MAFLRFTLRQLETFLTVAELHSFTEAGERLGLTPSAVSQLIQELENAVGFRLFDRSTRRVVLSGLGKEFLGSVESVLKYARQAETVAGDVKARATGVVRIAAPLVIASTLLPKAIKAYAATQPQVVVRIRDCPVDRLVEAVAEGDADLAIGPNRACGEEVAPTALFDSPWVLWCAPDHPLAELDRVNWQDLRNHALVAAGRDHERNVALMRTTLPEEERITPIDVVDNISTALGIAAAGLAATLSPAYVEALAKPFGLVMRHIVDPEVVRQVCLYQPARRLSSPAAMGFAEYLTAWIATHVPA